MYSYSSSKLNTIIIQSMANKVVLVQRKVGGCAYKQIQIYPTQNVNEINEKNCFKSFVLGSFFHPRTKGSLDFSKQQSFVKFPARAAACMLGWREPMGLICNKIETQLPDHSWIMDAGVRSWMSDLTCHMSIGTVIFRIHTTTPLSM